MMSGCLLTNDMRSCSPSLAYSLHLMSDSTMLKAATHQYNYLFGYQVFTRLSNDGEKRQPVGVPNIREEIASKSKPKCCPIASIHRIADKACSRKPGLPYARRRLVGSCQSTPRGRKHHQHEDEDIAHNRYSGSNLQ